MVVTDILQPTHLIFVLVIALLVLGPKRLPEVGRSLGRGLRDFRAAVSGDEQDRHEEIPYESPAASRPPVASQAPVTPQRPVADEPVAASVPEPEPHAAEPEPHAAEPTREEQRVGQP